ncbi:hypothetical protein JCM3774_002525 [Rhodotorula dairenensis]
MSNEPAVFSLPPEASPPILIHCLTLSTPEACAAFAQTCTAAKAHCQAAALWRGLHKATWDPPPTPPSYSYEAVVKKRTRAAIRLENRPRTCADPLPDHQDWILVVRALIEAALERPHGQGPSRNEDWLVELLRAAPPGRAAGSEGILFLPTGHGVELGGRSLRSSPALTGYLPAVPRLCNGTTAPAAIDTARLSELVARLHTLATPSPLAFTSPSIRTRAKEIVYTRANWTRHSCYGPFQSDGSGRVDWRKVEALAIVAGANLADGRAMGWGRPPRTAGAAAAAAGSHARGLGGTASSSTSRGPEVVGPAIPPRGWASTRPLSAGPVRSDPEGRDWSGLTSHELVGSYMFLHYPTFFAFQSRSSPPPLGDEDEAVGDCLPMIFELLPEGQWPAEIEHTDLSIEAQGLAEEDDEDDRDWSGASDSDDDDNDDESLYDERDDEEPSDLAARMDYAQSRSTSTGSRQSAGLSSQSVRPGLAHQQQYDPAAGVASTSASASVEAPTGNNFAFSSLSSSWSSLPSPPSPLPAAGSTASSAIDLLTYVPLHPGQSPGRAAHHASFDVEHLVPSPAAAVLPSTRLCPPAGTVPHPTHPTLAFRGCPGSLRYTDPGQPVPASRPGLEGLYHAEARTFRGTIEWLPEDRVAKVSFIVRYAGEDQWLLTGVQFGGPGSRAGFVGVWTSADHSPESPSGPFMYWPHVRPKAT